MKKTEINNPVEPDLKKALKLVLSLMTIPGQSSEEKLILKTITDMLKKEGLSSKYIHIDRANKKSYLGGETGNLIVTLPGTYKAHRRLLMAHVDTLPICVGSKAKVNGNLIISANPKTALGADDRSGTSIVLTALLEILKQKLPHPPLTFLFTVQEETGLLGAKHVALSKLKKPKLALNVDGPFGMILGAAGITQFDIHIKGKASHAGAKPEEGISSMTVLGLAIADLEKKGWLGKISKGKIKGTSNLGSVHGGDSTNVVMQDIYIKGECRSLSRKDINKIYSEFKKAFEKAAKKVKNNKRECAKVEFINLVNIEPFKLKESEPSVKELRRSFEACGVKPFITPHGGSLDANEMFVHGIATVTMGTGHYNAHTLEETLQIDKFQLACRIALRFATGR